MTATTFTEDDYREGMAALAKVENARFQKLYCPTSGQHGRKGKPMNPDARNALRFLASQGKAASRELAEHLGQSSVNMTEIMSRLRVLGLAERHGDTVLQGRRMTVWALTDRGAEAIEARQEGAP
jgi:DNA-binding MarR family transcriptional regulator